jgi:biofilm protein TabA
MIFDTLTHSARYRDLDPRLAKAFAWLEQFSPDQPDGRVDIEGDEVFALVQSYETVNPAERKFESHRKYADLQYIAAGDETMYYAPLATLSAATEYDSVKDFTLYSEPAGSTPLRMIPGSFAVFYPQDGHKPGCVASAPARVKKVVIKISV